MQRIINGKLYNTETAKRIGSRDTSYSQSDFRYLEEDMYRKKTGEFFLAGKGGPMTHYVEYVGDMMTWGSGIIPLSEEEAKAWAEEYLSVEGYIEVFGEPEE